MLDKYTFNKEKIYEEKVVPILDELKKVCSAERIPMFASFAVKNDPVDTKYKSTAVSTINDEIVLTKDYIREYINIQNGFRTYYEEMETVDMEKEFGVDDNAK